MIARARRRALLPGAMLRIRSSLGSSLVSFACAFALGACASPAGPIAPPQLPQAPVAYSARGASFMAPADGQPTWSEDEASLSWNAGAKLTIGAVQGDRGALSESDVERALHRIPGLAGQPLTKEEAPGLAIFCMQGAAPATVAACARIDEEARRGGSLVITTFLANAAAFTSLGGTRVAAEAAKSARGFRSAPSALPPP
jgi:hypothetical protein